MFKFIKKDIERNIYCSDISGIDERIYNMVVFLRDAVPVDGILFWQLYEDVAINYSCADLEPYEYRMFWGNITIV